MRLLAILPLGGGLTALLGADDAEADGRRRRRKKRHKHGKGRHRGGRKKKCKAKSRAKTCAGKCGTVKNDCKKRVDCGPCVQCDVCASGCQYSRIQEAIDDPAGPTTIRLCAETYGGNITIDKDLTLIGAGDGEDGTVLDGEGSGEKVHIIGVAVTVTLQDLRITGGSTTDGGGVHIAAGNTVAIQRCTVTGNTATDEGGGIFNGVDSTVTLTDCTISDNTAEDQGGGIYNLGGSVTLNGTSSVTGNTATDGSGGGIYNLGTVTLNDDSSVKENDPDDCTGSGTFSGNACGP